MHAERDGQQEIQHAGQEIDFRAEIILIHGLQDGQANILDEVDRKGQDNQDGNPIRIFKAWPCPESDEWTTKDDEPRGYQSQQIILPAADLDEQRRQFLHRPTLRHEFRDMRQINTRDGRGKSHIVHVDQRRDGINRHSACPLHDAQDDLIRLPENLVNEADKEDTECQFLEIMEQCPIPIVKTDRDMQACKAVIHARKDQGHVQAVCATATAIAVGTFCRMRMTRSGCRISCTVSSPFKNRNFSCALMTERNTIVERSRRY